MIDRRFRSIAGAMLVAALVTISLRALAQEVYPSRPIEMIVPWGPGGGSDQTGRKIAKLLENELKVSLPVVNVPPDPAATNVVFVGTGSMIVTLVAVRLPVFLTVIV